MGLSVSGSFVCRCLPNPTVLRFHLPLIEPDVRICRIRLSDGVRQPAHEQTRRCALHRLPSSFRNRRVVGGGTRQHGHSPDSWLLPERSRSQAPFLHRHYPVSSVLRACPPPHTARPVPRGHPVGCSPTAGVSRVACALPVQTCRRPYPGGTAGGIKLLPWNLRPRPSPSPWRVGSHISSFEACSAFT